MGQKAVRNFKFVRLSGFAQVQARMVGGNRFGSRNLVAMARFTGEQRAFCVKAYYENGDSSTIAQRIFRSEYDLHDLNQCPTESVIRSWVRKFESTGSTLNVKPTGRPRSIRTEETVGEVSTSLQSDPQLSTRERSSRLGISRSSLRRVTVKHLKFLPYKLFYLKYILYKKIIML